MSSNPNDIKTPEELKAYQDHLSEEARNSITGEVNHKKQNQLFLNPFYQKIRKIPSAHQYKVAGYTLFALCMILNTATIGVWSYIYYMKIHRPDVKYFASPYNGQIVRIYPEKR